MRPRELTKELIMLACWVGGFGLGLGLLFTSDDIVGLLGLLLAAICFLLTIHEINYLKGFR